MYLCRPHKPVHSCHSPVVMPHHLPAALPHCLKKLTSSSCNSFCRAHAGAEPIHQFGSSRLLQFCLSATCSGSAVTWAVQGEKGMQVSKQLARFVLFNCQALNRTMFLSSLITCCQLSPFAAHVIAMPPKRHRNRPCQQLCHAES